MKYKVVKKTFHSWGEGKHSHYVIEGKSLLFHTTVKAKGSKLDLIFQTSSQAEKYIRGVL